MPPNRKCRLFFWSGLADPTVDALALTYKDKLLNINGVSSTHCTDNYPSLTGIRSMGFDLGGYYQVFAPIDMDFYYMNGFSGPLYGFEKVIQTFELTDKPRRFKPIDIYYHFYAASMPASLHALIKVYQWALNQPVMNIYISEYIKKVLDFNRTIIAKKNDYWIIYTQGDVRELRSQPKFGYPDLVKSENIIGFSDKDNDRYIHLGPGRLTVLCYQTARPSDPYLVEANAAVTFFARDDKQFKVKFHGHMPLECTFANVNNCKVTSKPELHAVTNSDKTVSYSTKESQGEISFNCR